jgi:hypothetical protein
VFVKLHSSSQLSLSEFENYVREIGDQRFSNLENQPTTNPINYKERVSLPMYLLVHNFLCSVLLFGLYLCFRWFFR